MHKRRLRKSTTEDTGLENSITYTNISWLRIPTDPIAINCSHVNSKKSSYIVVYRDKWHPISPRHVDDERNIFEVRKDRPVYDVSSDISVRFRRWFPAYSNVSVIGEKSDVSRCSRWKISWQTERDETELTKSTTCYAPCKGKLSTHWKRIIK